MTWSAPLHAIIELACPCGASVTISSDSRVYVGEQAQLWRAEHHDHRDRLLDWPIPADALPGTAAAVQHYDCLTCQGDGTKFVLEMVVCQLCGNKRCPRATDHRLSCTNSNEPGQPGSAYTTVGGES